MSFGLYTVDHLDEIKSILDKCTKIQVSLRGEDKSLTFSPLSDSLSDRLRNLYPNNKVIEEFFNHCITVQSNGESDNLLPVFWDNFSVCDGKFYLNEELEKYGR